MQYLLIGNAGVYLLFLISQNLEDCFKDCNRPSYHSNNLIRQHIPTLPLAMFSLGLSSDLSIWSIFGNALPSPTNY